MKLRSMKPPTAGRTLLIIFVTVIAFIILLIVLAVASHKLSSRGEKHKLLNEIKSLNLSPAMPQVISYSNEPTNPELLFSNTYPGVLLRLSLSQTTLSDEITVLQSVLESKGFKINYNAQSSPTDIIGTREDYFINISLEYNGSEPSLVKSGQRSTFNGEPIFTEPGADTPINDLQINLEDTSHLGSRL